MVLSLVVCRQAVAFDDPLGGVGTESRSFNKWRFSGVLKGEALGYRIRDLPVLEDGDELSGRVYVRLRLEANPVKWLALQVHGTVGGQGSTSREALTLGQLTNATTSRFRVMDLESTWEEEEDYALYGSVNYANVAFSFQKSTVTLGRQAMSYGRTFFWNPTDWLASFNPTEFDREYKPGIDAIRWEAGLGNFTGVEVVYATGDEARWDTSAAMGRAYTNIADWDFDLLVGRIQTENRWGFGFSGELGGAGLRGEAAYHHPARNNGGDFWRATVEADYRFPSSLFLMGEVHFNGFGSDETERYAQLLLNERVQNGEFTNVGRWYLAGQASYEFTPLILGTGAVLVNMLDGSGLGQVQVNFSLSDEMDIQLGGIVPWGASPEGILPQSEYGLYPLTGWLLWRMYF